MAIERLQQSSTIDQEASTPLSRISAKVIFCGRSGIAHDSADSWRAQPGNDHPQELRDLSATCARKDAEAASELMKRRNGRRGAAETDCAEICVSQQETFSNRRGHNSISKSPRQRADRPPAGAVRGGDHLQIEFVERFDGIGYDTFVWASQVKTTEHAIDGYVGEATACVCQDVD